MPSVVEWVEAPPARTSGGSNEHEKIATALKTKPGQWARVFKGVKSATSASTINTGAASAYAPRGSFEATSRQVGEGKYDIYAKYVGQAAK